MLFDPEVAIHTCPMSVWTILPSEFLTSSAHLQIGLTGLNHFSFRLRPTVSSPTLNPCRYLHRPKVQYTVRWVGASVVALSATSDHAPRGAPKSAVKEFIINQQVKI